MGTFESLTRIEASIKPLPSILNLRNIDPFYYGTIQDTLWARHKEVPLDLSISSMLESWYYEKSVTHQHH